MHLVYTNDQPARQRPSAHASGVMGQQKNQMNDVHVHDGLGKRISQGLRADEFYLMFQGVYHVGTGQLSHAEAQVRWKHPDYGLLLPGVFMPQLEQSDVAYEMSCFMFSRVCRELSVCPGQGFEPCPVSIGVQASAIVHERFAEDIRDIALFYGVAPNLLELELPESEDAARVLSIRALTRDLRDLGVGISYSDFGAGRAPLASLGALDIDTVRLARDLVATVPGDSRSCKLVEGLLALLETLDVRVVASGVETEDQVRWLRQWPGVLAQGARWPRTRSGAERVDAAGVRPLKNRFRYPLRYGSRYVTVTLLTASNNRLSRRVPGQDRRCAPCDVHRRKLSASGYR